MKKFKSLMTICVASAMTMQFGACQQAQHENPLLQESSVPFGAPDFSKIQTSDYMPAFEVAIQQTRDNIQKIVESEDSATFENTILAYEESGRLLDRVSRVFFALTEAEKTPEIGDIEKKVQPMLKQTGQRVSAGDMSTDADSLKWLNSSTPILGAATKRIVGSLAPRGMSLAAS